MSELENIPKNQSNNQISDAHVNGNVGAENQPLKVGEKEMKEPRVEREDGEMGEDQAKDIQEKDGKEDKGEKDGKEDKEEKEGKDDESKKVPDAVGYWEMYKYSPKNIRILVPIAMIFSIIHGATLPAFTFYFGDMADTFTPDKPSDELRRTARNQSIVLLGVGGVTLLTAGLGMLLWKYIGDKTTAAVQEIYFKKLLDQELGYFDVQKPEVLTTRYSESIGFFKIGAGQANHTFIFSAVVAVGGFFVGFLRGWLLSIIVMVALPFMIIGMSIFIFFIQKEMKITQKNYEKAGSYSEQVISSIRTVFGLNGQDHEEKRYIEAIKPAMKKAITFGIWIGLSSGSFFAVILIAYGFGFFAGAKLVENEVKNNNTGDPYSVGDVIIVFFSVINGAFTLGQISPAMQKITKAKQSVYKIFEVIERKPEIILDDPSKIKPKNITGEVEFSHVRFNYPSRKDVTVLEDMSCKIEKGTKVAFVGETGCGKSTTIQLIERFYDVLEGEVKIDGKNIKDYNLKDLRDFIGYVGQEPVLFAMSIKENLLMAKHDATDEEIKAALQQANAYDFVQTLENNIDTYVGVGGGSLSGGQKQRIAIARTILQNPAILLLDESTSALDRKNEREIQATLDKISKNRTTVVIAHRLSTIKNSDKIFVIKDGVVAEEGSHEELLALDKHYANLVKHQLTGKDKDKMEVKHHIKDNNDAIMQALEGNIDSELDEYSQKDAERIIDFVRKIYIIFL